MARRLAVVLVALVAAACPGPAPSATPPATAIGAPAGSGSPTAPTVPPTASPTPATATLAIDATGLGPCHQPWYSPCLYGIRLEGAGGYDRRGVFTWDSGPPPSGEMGQGTAGPVSSTGVVGELPMALPPGVWTLSFRLYYGSDVASYHPVPGGTPRPAEEDPFIAACSTRLDTTGAARVTVHVAFKGRTCTVVTRAVRG